MKTIRSLKAGEVVVINFIKSHGPITLPALAQLFYKEEKDMADHLAPLIEMGFVRLNSFNEYEAGNF